MNDRRGETCGKTTFRKTDTIDGRKSARENGARSVQARVSSDAALGLDE